MCGPAIRCLSTVLYEVMTSSRRADKLEFVGTQGGGVVKVSTRCFDVGLLLLQACKIKQTPLSSVIMHL